MSIIFTDVYSGILPILLKYGIENYIISDKTTTTNTTTNASNHTNGSGNNCMSYDLSEYLKLSPLETHYEEEGQTGTAGFLGCHGENGRNPEMGVFGHPASENLNSYFGHHSGHGQLTGVGEEDNICIYKGPVLECGHGTE